MLSLSSSSSSHSLCNYIIFTHQIPHANPLHTSRVPQKFLQFDNIIVSKHDKQHVVICLTLGCWGSKTSSLHYCRGQSSSNTLDSETKVHIRNHSLVPAKETTTRGKPLPDLDCFIHQAQCSILKSSMPFKCDLALQNIHLSKQLFIAQLQIENEEVTWSPQYNLPVTRTNKRRTLSLQEVQLDGCFLILHICTGNMYHIIHAQI